MNFANNCCKKCARKKFYIFIYTHMHYKYYFILYLKERRKETKELKANVHYKMEFLLSLVRI